MVLVLGNERYKGGTRVRFVCGHRALAGVPRSGTAIVDARRRLLSSARTGCPRPSRRCTSSRRSRPPVPRPAGRARSRAKRARLLAAAPATGRPSVVATFDGWPRRRPARLARHWSPGAVRRPAGQPRATRPTSCSRSPTASATTSRRCCKRRCALLGGRGGGKGNMAQGGGDRVERPRRGAGRRAAARECRADRRSRDERGPTSLLGRSPCLCVSRRLDPRPPGRTPRALAVAFYRIGLATLLLAPFAAAPARCAAWPALTPRRRLAAARARASPWPSTSPPGSPASPTPRSRPPSCSSTPRPCSRSPSRGCSCASACAPACSAAIGLALAGAAPDRGRRLDGSRRRRCSAPRSPSRAPSTLSALPRDRARPARGAAAATPTSSGCGQPPRRRSAAIAAGGGRAPHRLSRRARWPRSSRWRVVPTLAGHGLVNLLAAPAARAHGRPVPARRAGGRRAARLRRSSARRPARWTLAGGALVLAALAARRARKAER